MGLVGESNEMSEDARLGAVGLHLAEDDVFRVESVGDGGEIALTARQAQDAGIADDTITLVTESGELLDAVSYTHLDVYKRQDIGLVRLPPGNDLVEIPFEVRNSGKSDAKDVTIKIRGVYLPKGIDPDFSYGAPNVASIHALILTPNETTKPPLGQENTPVSHVVSVGNPDGTVLHRTPQDIGNINDGSATIFVYGDLRYTDVFGVRRWQTFCQALMSVLALHADSNIQTATGPGEKCGNYNKEQSIEAAPPVSYTHLDVYKRQDQGRALIQNLGFSASCDTAPFKIWTSSDNPSDGESRIVSARFEGRDEFVHVVGLADVWVGAWRDRAGRVCEGPRQPAQH